METIVGFGQGDGRAYSVYDSHLCLVMNLLVVGPLHFVLKVLRVTRLRTPIGNVRSDHGQKH